MLRFVKRENLEWSEKSCTETRCNYSCDEDITRLYKFRITNLHGTRPNSDRQHESINKFHYVIIHLQHIFICAFAQNSLFPAWSAFWTYVSHAYDAGSQSARYVQHVRCIRASIATCQWLRMWLRLFQMRNTPSGRVAEITLSNCAFRDIKATHPAVSIFEICNSRGDFISETNRCRFQLLWLTDYLHRLWLIRQKVLKKLKNAKKRTYFGDSTK